jgi:hypothetical protein
MLLAVTVEGYHYPHLLAAFSSAAATVAPLPLPAIKDGKEVGREWKGWN